MKSVALLMASIVSLTSIAGGETTPRFLNVTYNNEQVNVYGYLNDDIICVESGGREPGIIKISELDDEDAFKVARKARNDEFKYSNPKLNEITRMFVMSNSVKVKVDLIVAQRHKNYLITNQSASKKFNFKFTHVQYIKVRPGVDLKRGDQLPPMHRWCAGKVLNPSIYYICPPIDYNRDQDLALNVADLDDAVQLLAGWMLVHKDDYYVQNTLMGIRAKLPQKASAEVRAPSNMGASRSQNCKDAGRLPVDRPRIIHIPGLSSTKCSYRNGIYKIVDYYGHVYETPYKVDFDNAIKDIKKRGNLRKNTNVYHVPTAEEIAAAEEERKRQEALEEDRRRFEAQLDVESQRVRAIEEQNAILNDIRWSIDNQPPPVNNTYIVTPPPRRRWR